MVVNGSHVNGNTAAEGAGFYISGGRVLARRIRFSRAHTRGTAHPYRAFRKHAKCQSAQTWCSTIAFVA